MSWKITEKLKKRSAAESGAVSTRRGAALRICLVYPNRYRLAMSNLGFQAVYALANSRPDVLCERAFLPDPDELREYETSRTPLLTLESRQPVADFDVIAFSISFESDYLNVPSICQLVGLAPFAADRGDGDPLLLAGGAALFLNPEPVADFFDIIGVGEGEIILPPLLAVLESSALSRSDLLVAAAEVPGVYVPSLGRRPVVRQYLADLDRAVTATQIRTPETEFADLHLVEISRGCPRGCRFCAAGFIYLPYRQRSLARLQQAADEAVAAGRKIGLVAAAVGDYRGIGDLCRHIVDQGGKFSVASLRIDGLDDTMVDLLAASGHKTATLAPEGGSQRLRDLVRKGITEEQILAACERLIAKDILNLKLYFIVGLPTETDADIAELLDLITRIRELVVARAKANRRLGEIVISVNPFIPKPFTPLQWCGMQSQKVLESRIAQLRQGLRPLANVSLQVESLKEAMLQALLSRGDRSLGAFIVRAAELGNWRKAAKDLGLDLEEAVTRQIPLTEELPWEFIGGVSPELLRREYRAAFGLK